MSSAADDQQGGATEPLTIAELALFLMSEHGAADFTMRYGPDGASAVQGILSLFGEIDGGVVKINVVQTASASLKEALGTLVAQHASTAPHLHRLKKFVHDLQDDEHFLLLPNRPDSTASRLECERAIYRLNHPDAAAADYGGVMDLFATLLERYDMNNPRTDRQTMLGSGSKAERRCRFCDRSSADGATFKSVAHAIPTALGNDHLKLADECDECNGYFGRETEPSLIAMLDIPRAYLGTQGRGGNDGRPELRFEHGKLHHDGQGLNVRSDQVVRDEATGRMTVELGKGAPFIPAAAYRALAKIALSVIDADGLLPVSWTPCLGAS